MLPEHSRGARPRNQATKWRKATVELLMEIGTSLTGQLLPGKIQQLGVESQLQLHSGQGWATRLRNRALCQIEKESERVAQQMQMRLSRFHWFDVV
jgi:hypothetical protein